MAGSGSSILLSAADVTWSRREQTCVTAVADSSGSLDATYFTLSAPASIGGTEGLFYVWIDVDNSSVDPAPAGRTGIEVDIATDDTAITVAAAIQAAVEANGNFRAALDPNDSTTVIIGAEYGGEVTATADVDTGFTFVQLASGFGGALGRTSGGIEVGLESARIDITTDQTGPGIFVDSVFGGNSVTVSMSFIDTDRPSLKKLISAVAGDVFTPSGGTELIGIGESRVYGSLFDLGGELILHPTRKDASDRTLDWNFWKAAPLPGSFNFSGEDPSLLEVEFVCLADKNTQDTINILAIGDGTQDVRA